MKIHEKLERFYYLAKKNNKCKDCADGCQWVSCGPDARCLNVNNNTIPCKMCGFWSCYGMSEDDLYRAELKLFLIEMNLKGIGSL